MALFLAAVFGVGVLSGATASVLGFGIGSMLTPLLTAQLGASLAVAAVSLPHAVATAVRCWRLRKHVACDVLRRFGLLSAAGGLAGALLYTQLGPSALGRVLGSAARDDGRRAVDRPVEAVAARRAGRVDAGARFGRSAAAWQAIRAASAPRR